MKAIWKTWLRLLVVLSLCGIADSAQAAPILEPNFKKVNPNPDGDFKLKAAAPTQGDKAEFTVTDPSDFSNVLNDTGVTIYDLHLKIIRPNTTFADATWADVDGDGKVGTPADGIFDTSTLSADGKEITLVGGTILPGESFSPLFKIKDLEEDGRIRVEGFWTTPEPSTLLLLGSSLAGWSAVAWRRHRRKSAPCPRGVERQGVSSKEPRDRRGTACPHPH